jgi:hypothetical protein
MTADCSDCSSFLSQPVVIDNTNRAVAIIAIDLLDTITHPPQLLLLVIIKTFYNTKKKRYALFSTSFLATLREGASGEVRGICGR